MPLKGPQKSKRRPVARARGREREGEVAGREGWGVSLRHATNAKQIDARPTNTFSKKCDYKRIKPPAENLLLGLLLLILSLLLLLFLLQLLL